MGIVVFEGDISKTNPKDRKNKLLEDILEDFEESKIYLEVKEEDYVIKGSNYVWFGYDYEEAIKNQSCEDSYGIKWNI